jgi:hypothetical protein
MQATSDATRRKKYTTTCANTWRYSDEGSGISTRLKLEERSTAQKRKKKAKKKKANG